VPIRASIHRVILAAACALALSAPAHGQYIPPHSNDPHPPANQPSYQLPGPLSRPGVGQYPGAPHSNDPYFRKTEPRIEWPQSTIPPSARGSTPPLVIQQYPPSNYRPPAARRQDKARDRKPKTISLEQCYRNWDRTTRMTRSAWERTCRRLSKQGRVRIE
jgi:hypothetical protein